MLAAQAPAVTPVAPPVKVDPKIADGSAARALAAARERWRRAAIGSYGFDAERSCFCFPKAKLIHVVVTRGRPGKAAAADVGEVATVPRMFKLIRRAIDKRYAGLTVKYGAYGVPRSISLDPDARIADDETQYAISRFARR